MKKISSLVLFLFICIGCSITNTDNLTYYRAFDLKRNEIRIDGYFFKEYSEKVWDGDGTASNQIVISPIFLYADGTVANFFSRYFQHADQIEKTIENNEKEIYAPEWGSYVIENDTIKIQTITKVDQSYFPPNFFDVIEWRGPIINDSTFLITEEIRPKGTSRRKKKISKTNILFKFHASKIKPDATRNSISKKIGAK
jgi:hypothetical protein